MEKEINAVLKSHLKYEKDCEILAVKIREVCDFNARLTWCAGDGHLVLNEETANVAPLGCLTGKTTTNKLSEYDHESASI